MSASLHLGQSARRSSILVVDDEPDVADLFRQRFRSEARQGVYIMHFAASGAEALDRLAAEIQPTLIASPTSTCRGWTAWSCWLRSSNDSPICRS
jgi:DNA-binding NtrC family response regulator